MVLFENRERAFEAHHAHQEEVRFYAYAMAVRRVADWAADMIGRSDLEVYEAEAMRAAIEGPDDAALIRKLLADLGARASEDEIRRRLSREMSRALQKLEAEG